MPTLNDLTLMDKVHWRLHIDACMKDTPSVRKEARVFLRGGKLPNIRHPSYIHDWLEQPDKRIEIEAWNG